MPMNACVNEVKFYEAADVIDDAAQEVEFELDYVKKVVGAHGLNFWLLEEAGLVVKYSEMVSCQPGEGAVSHGGGKKV